MGLFGKKKEKVVDWSEKYNLRGRSAIRKSPANQEDSSSNLGFLGGLASSSGSNDSSSSDVSWDNDTAPQEDYREKKTKLAKRLLDMTNKMEDLSNQIYHLKQRIELLEKKMKVSFE